MGTPSPEYGLVLGAKDIREWLTMSIMLAYRGPIAVELAASMKAATARMSGRTIW